jgi:hypothetical protein
LTEKILKVKDGLVVGSVPAHFPLGIVAGYGIIVLKIPGSVGDKFLEVSIAQGGAS